jgi:hypothetical protein
MIGTQGNAVRKLTVIRFPVKKFTLKTIPISGKAMFGLSRRPKPLLMAGVISVPLVNLVRHFASSLGEPHENSNMLSMWQAS